MQHYIFGYGSLINADSRAKTGQTGRSWPAKVIGFQRHWSVMSPEFGMSSVAVVQRSNSFCNGVLVEIDETELPLFDEREAGYLRAQVPMTQIQGYETTLPEGVVWIYHTETVTPPNDQAPIALSYADVILAGCLSINESFASEFISSTGGWEHAILNDRQQPRYPRVQTSLNTDLLKPHLEVVSAGRICTITSYHRAG